MEHGEALLLKRREFCSEKAVGNFVRLGFPGLGRTHFRRLLEKGGEEADFPLFISCLEKSLEGTWDLFDFLLESVTYGLCPPACVSHRAGKGNRRRRGGGGSSGENTRE